MRCPRCLQEQRSQPLKASDALVLGCASGHRFDVNKRGYLTVLEAAKGVVGDPREMLEARARFLARGHYDPIADAVLAALPASPASLSVLDSGTGTGFYLAAVLSGAGQHHEGLAVDASSAAVAMSVATTGACGLVADVWQPSPVRDDRADVILCVFAPRNPGEFARILRPGGRLVVVTPTERHLAELREAGLLMGMQAAKRERLDESLDPFFDLLERNETSYVIDLDAAAVRDLTTMGPSGHHDDPQGTWPGGAVTVSIECSVFTPRG